MINIKTKDNQEAMINDNGLVINHDNKTIYIYDADFRTIANKTCKSLYCPDLPNLSDCSEYNIKVKYKTDWLEFIIFAPIVFAIFNYLIN